MGGLGAASEPVTASESGLSAIAVENSVKSVEYYNLQGVRVDASYRGFAIIVTTLADGTTTATKTMMK